MSQFGFLNFADGANFTQDVSRNDLWVFDHYQLAWAWTGNNNLSDVNGTYVGGNEDLIPRGRRSHNVALINNFMYIFGGATDFAFDDTFNNNDFWTFNISALNLQAPSTTTLTGTDSTTGVLQISTSTTSATPIDPVDQTISSSQPNTAAIVGAAVGAPAGIAFIVVGVFIYIRKRKGRSFASKITEIKDMEILDKLVDYSGGKTYCYNESQLDF